METSSTMELVNNVMELVNNFLELVNNGFPAANRVLASVGVYMERNADLASSR